MKKIEAIIRTSRFDYIHRCISKLGVKFLSFYEVKGMGFEHARQETYRGVAYEPAYIPRTKLEIVVPPFSRRRHQLYPPRRKNQRSRRRENFRLRCTRSLPHSQPRHGRSRPLIISISLHRHRSLNYGSTCSRPIHHQQPLDDDIHLVDFYHAPRICHPRSRPNPS